MTMKDEDLDFDVEIVDEAPVLPPVAPGPYTAAGAFGPTDNDPVYVEDRRRVRRGGALRAAFFTWWLMTPALGKLFMIITGVVLTLMALLGLVTMAPVVAAMVLTQPAAWPFVALLVTWLVARRRDGRGPVDHVRRLIAVTRVNLKAVRAGVIFGAAGGLVMAVVHLVEGGFSAGGVVYGVLAVSGCLTLGAVAVAAYLEPRS